MNLKLRKILWYFSVTLNIYLLLVKIIPNLKVAPKVWSYVVNCKWPHSQKKQVAHEDEVEPLAIFNLLVRIFSIFVNCNFHLKIMVISFTNSTLIFFSASISSCREALSTSIFLKANIGNDFVRLFTRFSVNLQKFPKIIVILFCNGTHVLQLLNLILQVPDYLAGITELI